MTFLQNGARNIKVRRGLAIGSTGTFPGGLAADLARCPVFFFIIIIYLFILLFFFFFFLPSQCAKVIISDCGIP